MQTYVVNFHEMHLTEAFLMSVLNMFWWKNKKNVCTFRVERCLICSCVNMVSLLLLQTTAVRISAESNSSNISYPTIFVVRQERSVLSWQIPLLLQYT